MANKYEKIDFGSGQNTPTGDTIYDAFDKVNKAFDEIENDIANIDVDLSDYAKNEDLQEFENETNQKITDLESDIEDSLVLEKAPNRGIYLKNRDESKYAPIGLTAIDLSIYYGDQWLIGAKTYAVAIGTDAGAGNNSVAIGNFVSNINAQHAVAIGSSIQNYYNNYSVSIGHRASAGENSVAIGNQATSFNKGVAIGELAKAGGLKSVAFGDTLSNSAYCLTIGRYNNRGGQQTAWANGSEIFIVGNGTSESNRSNAYQLNNNGTSTQWGIASYGADYSANFTANSLVSKKYVDDKIANIDVDLTNYYIKSEIDDLIANAGGDSVLAKKANNSIYFDGRDETKFNATGVNSIDLAYYYVVNATGAKIGAQGENSVAIGGNSGTIGMYSNAIGYNSQSAGSYSTSVGYVSKTGASAFGSASFGFNSTANGYTSYAFGNRTTTNARESVALGNNLTANNFGSTVIGRYNQAPATVESNYTIGSPLFVIGNGTHSSNLSNAYVLNNNATSTQYGIASYSADFSADFTDNSLISKKYADVKIANVGIYTNQNTRIGEFATNDGSSSTAFGYWATAGDFSTAIGSGTNASGYGSTAIGQMASAYNLRATAVGSQNGAVADFSTLVGTGLTTYTWGETIVGRFNEYPDIPPITELLPTNRLFTIGNGTSEFGTDRSNAYIMLQDGSSTQFNVANYNDDYSASFTEHSLVDKKYVDSKLTDDLDLTNLTINKTMLFSPNNEDDVLNIRRYGANHTLINVLSPPQTTWGGAKESTLALVRGDNNEYFLDLYNMDYGDVDAGNNLDYGEAKMGIRLQKRGTGEFTPFNIEYGNGEYVQKAIEITPNGTDAINNNTEVHIYNKLTVDGNTILKNIASYSADYSASFTAHSLVNKKYVDEKLSNNIEIDEDATNMDKATLNANYSDKNVGFVLYCTHEDLQTKYVKLSLTDWSAEPYFLAN